MKTELNITALDKWLPDHKRPVIISGPCGAETEKQLMQTAAGLAKLNRVTIFRSGIWKPRTRPNSFEGVGTIGLQWLKEVKNKYGFLTTVEVANAQHVEEALKNNVDILWVGARTTVNPFSVQEIADSLKGIDIPVMVKNPIHADLQLWIGALERINQAGIKKLIAIHRGFYTHDKAKYRNPPQWDLPIELKTHFPDLPIICDPSHICGNTELLLQVSQKALNLNFDGLMLESHFDPAIALSDKNQQLKPAELGELLNELIVRTVKSTSEEFTNTLVQLRKVVDEVDEEILKWVAKRMDLVEKIGEYKRENNITVLQLERWLDILKTRTSLAETKSMDVDFVRKLYQLIHKESIRKQTEVLNTKTEKS